MYSRLGNRRRMASSSSKGRLVAPSTSTRLADSQVTPNPSIWTMNSVFRRRELSVSWSERLVKRLSISSTKMIAGCSSWAMRNRALTNFSPSPTHLDVRVLALMLKKVAPPPCAHARARKVLPVPGGPKRRIPRLGARSPVNKSGRCSGSMTDSYRACLASSSPTMSSQLTVWSSLGTTQFRTVCSSLWSAPARCNRFSVPVVSAPPLPRPLGAAFA
mmetsp:Transcript_17662/g.31328  ORF Transcript_17662/g.31328 Transcript_17662/m.31328 type:complete len:217 (-) Transcript_17662:651-1301(-)